MLWEVRKQVWSRKSLAEVTKLPKSWGGESGQCVELHLLLEAREGLENSWNWDFWVLLL